MIDLKNIEHIQNGYNLVQPVMNDYGGPIGLAGKIVGLGKDEITAGVPGWAYFTIGLIIGGVLTFSLRENIERVIK